jgi:hypothetical protein
MRFDEQHMEVVDRRLVANAVDVDGAGQFFAKPIEAGTRLRRDRKKSSAHFFADVALVGDDDAFRAGGLPKNLNVDFIEGIRTVDDDDHRVRDAHRAAREIHSRGFHRIVCRAKPAESPA